MRKIESTCEKHFDNKSRYIAFSGNIDDVYGNIEDCSQRKRLKISIAFDDMIAKKKIMELLIRRRKIYISIVLATQLYFKVSGFTILQRHQVD